MSPVDPARHEAFPFRLPSDRRPVGGALLLHVGVLLLVAAVAAGCGEDDRSREAGSSADAAGSSPAAAATGDAPSGAPAPPSRDGRSAGHTAAPVRGGLELLECGREGFPCTWLEVDSATLRRTDAVGRIAAGLMRSTASPERVGRLLASAPGVAAVAWGEFAVRFRLAGGRPAWIYAPFDPENPRLGGAPPVSAGPSSDRASPEPARRPRAEAKTSPATGAVWPAEAHLPAAPVAREEQESDRMAGETGKPKRALVLSPFEWQGEKTEGMVPYLADARDFRREDGGNAVTYLANRLEGLRTPGTGSGPPSSVTLADFLRWDDFDLVYLATHGARVCPGGRTPGAGGAKRCHTSLMVGQQVDPSAGPEALDMVFPGVDLVYSLTNLHPDLTSEEAAECVEAVDQGEPDPRTATGQPCLETLDKPYATLAVTTDFFRWAYPSGLEDAVLFLAACQSLMEGDLAEHFTGNGMNRDIAVFGYDGAVYSDHARNVGIAFAKFVLAGVDTEVMRDELPTITPRFTGTIMGPGGEPGELVEHASTPTHPRDVAELVDPFTGAELEDGASVVLRGEAGDGIPDTLGLRMRLRGMTEERTDPEEVGLSISVDGDDYGPAAAPTRVEGEYLWAVEEDDAPVGRDLPEDSEVVDLTVRAELPEAGESRWSYRDVRLEGCWFRIEYSGAREGVVQGHQISHNTRDGFPDFGPTAHFWLAARDQGVALTLAFQDPGLVRGRTGSWMAGTGELSGWGMDLTFASGGPGGVDFDEHRPPQLGGPRPFRVTISRNDWEDRIVGSFEGDLWKHRHGDLHVTGRFVWKRGACRMS